MSDLTPEEARRRIAERKARGPIYPHPGVWLFPGRDHSDNKIVETLIRFDCAVIGPVMCRLGKHRWISTGRDHMTSMSEWTTQCWYCQVPKP